VSSGKVHKIASQIAAIPTIIASNYIGADITKSLIAGVGCLAGIVLTPDLDQEGISHSEWNIIKKTYGLGFLWLLFWYPYALAMPHRCFLSHFPVISTILRLAYLLTIPFLLLAINDSATIKTILEFLPWFFFGLCVSDTLHYIMDNI